MSESKLKKMDTKIISKEENKVQKPEILGKKDESLTLKQKFKMKNQSQNIKSLLLDRFKQKKDKLMQSSSLYIGNGQVKKKKQMFSDKKDLLSLIRESSFEELPSLKKPKKILNEHRLSKTIDPYQSVNSSSLSVLNTIEESYKTINDRQFSNKSFTSNNLSKKRSSLETIVKSVEKIDQESNRQINKFSNNSVSFQLEKELKKKYLRSIVDRYFPSEQSTTQIQTKKFPTKNVFNSFVKKGKILTPNVKLPSLKIFHNEKQLQIKSKQTNVKEPSKQETPSKIINNRSQNQKLPQNLTIKQEILGKQELSAIQMSQSYILEQISENQQFQQDHFEAQNFYDSQANLETSKMFGSKSSTSLAQNSSMKDLFDSISSSNEEKNDSKRVKQKRKKVYQNHSFEIYKVRSFTYQNLSQSSNLKTVSFQTEFRKYFLNEAAFELKTRELRAKKIIESTSVNKAKYLWEQDLFDRNCIRIDLGKASNFLSRTPLTLSRLLYKISPFQLGGTSNVALIQPTVPNKYQFSNFTQQSLLQNYQYGLLKFVKNISIQLQSLSSSLINNKLSLNNIFMIQDDQYAINQWGYSFFKQEYIIQNKKFQKRSEPILKNQFNEWFVTPEYLAPQILQNLCYSPDQPTKYWKKIQGKKMEKVIVSQNDLFLYGNKSDVWSLGLMILQIITLIPMWIGEKSIVQNKISPKISPRKGFLHSQNRNLLKILTKQSYLKQNLNKILRIQSQPYKIEDWACKLLDKMLDLDPKTRISFSEIVKSLNEYEKNIKQKLKVFQR